MAHLVATAIVAAAAMIHLHSWWLNSPLVSRSPWAAPPRSAAPALLLRLAQSRYQRRFLDVFPDALDLIVRAVRVGLPLLEAIDLSTREIATPGRHRISADA